MKVLKLGSSLAICLPPAVVEALHLKEGDNLEIRAVGDRELVVSREPNREELLHPLRVFRGRLPADFRFDREEANSRLHC